jgi:hypothetical protein
MCNNVHGRFYDYVLGKLSEFDMYKWRLEEDASCGNEFVSPPLEGEFGWRQVVKICSIVKEAQAKFDFKRIVGVDCGVHFHFDANDLVKKSNRSVVGIRNILLLSAIIEPLWYSMSPESRLLTNFAAPLNFNPWQMMRARDMTDLRDIWFRPYMGVCGNNDSFRTKNTLYLPEFVNNDLKPEKYDWTRYHGMNFLSILKHGTIEFRYTHGSFDIDVLEMWFQMYKRLFEAAKKMRTKDILALCPISLELIKQNSIPGIHAKMYENLSPLINYLFKIIEPDIRLLRFILAKLIKHNINSIHSNVVKKIVSYDGDFEGLMKIVESELIQSAMFKRGRFKYVVPNELFPINDGPPNEIEQPDDLPAMVITTNVA